MKNKLNLGCRTDKRKNYVNLDIDSVYSPDVLWDLNKFPYPFKNNQFEEILAGHILEHLNDPIKVLKEWERISKKGAIIKIRVPHYLSVAAWGDITHKRAFNGQTFDVLNIHPEYYGLKMKLLSVRYKTYKNLFNWLVNIDRRLTEWFFAKVTLIDEIEFTLEVKK